MKFRDYLTEKYFGTATPWKGATSLTVFRNPSTKEWGEVKKEAFGMAMRGFVNPKNKDLFIWPGKGLHEVVYNELNFKTKMMRFVVANRNRKLFIWINEGPYWKSGESDLIKKALARFIPDIANWEVIME